MNKKLIYTIIAAICVTGIVGVSIAFLTSAKERATSSTSSAERTGLLLVMIWLINFCLLSTN